MLQREDYGLSVRVAEMAKVDNLQLAQAAASIVGAFGQLHDKWLIDDSAPVDLSYRFAVELMDVDRMMEKGNTRGGLSERTTRIDPCSRDDMA